MYTTFGECGVSLSVGGGISFSIFKLSSKFICSSSYKTDNVSCLFYIDHDHNNNDTAGYKVFTDKTNFLH